MLRRSLLTLRKQLLVLYGTQTGTAESYARSVAKYAGGFGYTPIVATMDEGAKLLSTKGVQDAAAAVYVCSTHGVGEFPLNAQQFWKQLVGGKLPMLKSIPYAILGLGNSKCDQFNVAAKALDHQLKKLGAKPLIGTKLSCEFAEGGHDAAYNAWKEQLWTALGHGESAPSADASTLTGRMEGSDMFCFQCEQTFRNKGCNKLGVCGKNPRVAALQDLTVHACKLLGFYANELNEMGETVPADANRMSLFAMFATLTNVNFDEVRFASLIPRIAAIVKRLRQQYTKACAQKRMTPKTPIGMSLSDDATDVDALVALGRNVSVLSRFSDPKTQSAAMLGEMLIYGLKGLAAYTDHSLVNNKEDPEVYRYMHKALGFMVGPDSFDLSKALGMCLECGKVNLKSMAMLYDSNKTFGVPSPHTVPVKPKPGKCIVVSGHDLVMLKRLLEKTEPLGINVYTHGEMLPAHGYPNLRAHKNLVGHFGGAWMRQGVEMPHFPGPILFTTNCIIEPREEYRGRVYTAGAVGWPGVQHIGDDMDNLNFDPVISAAMSCEGFAEGTDKFAYPDPVGLKRPEALTVGFGHETILSVAPTVLEAIKSGAITRFFLVGGCDGFEGQRSYYTELVNRMPKTAVVLTLGCGKYRVNHLDLGTIGNTGIPRILDMGQCNDSYGAIQVALALAQALNCKVSDLPLTIVLSWFEQKAVAVLLSLLHLGIKPIHIGPSLPAFVTPELVKVLVDQFGIRPVGDPAADLKEMLAAPGAS